MKYAVVIFLLFFGLFSCNDKQTNTKPKKRIEFFKFFDPFAFKGIQSIDSTSKDYPFYKVHYDSLGNITRIDEYPLAYGDCHGFYSWTVRGGNNNRMLFDSVSGPFEDEVQIKYRIFFDKKVITIYNYLFTNSNRMYTGFLKIYTPSKSLEYRFFGDGKINELDIDSAYLKKIVLVTPKDILENKNWLDTTNLEGKSIMYLSNTKNEIVVNTFYFDKDTSINQAFNYSNKRFDNYWVGKYNFYDSIGVKHYYEKHYKK